LTDEATFDVARPLWSVSRRRYQVLQPAADRPRSAQEQTMADWKFRPTPILMTSSQSALRSRLVRWCSFMVTWPGGERAFAKRLVLRGQHTLLADHTWV